MEQFRRAQQAITPAGQIKTAGERHEKDDRRAMGDRSRYVLGWSNAAKIAVLKTRQQTLETCMHTLAQQIGSVQSMLDGLRKTSSMLDKIGMFSDFSEQDWKPLALEIAPLEAERQKLESGSDILQVLQQQLTRLETDLWQSDNDLVQKNKELGSVEEKLHGVATQLTQCREIIDAAPQATDCFASLDADEAEALGVHTWRVDTCENLEQAYRSWLTGRIDAAEGRIGRLRDKITKAMVEFKTTYPLETLEMDVAIEAAGDYRSLLDRLAADDLPRFEARFKELLNENTIREVANFQSQLRREQQTIRERITLINQSLRQIDYNPGRYILLEAEANPDADLRDFQQELRACTEGALTGSEDSQYSEAKFIQVRAIIERFRGRDGTAELDRRWTRKVTDVRNWFCFSASERWNEDNSEHEHYTDSGGKSGGQKEKLAYTVLAASLAYQFGLEWGATRSRSFRFVVIDEAFGRGSDESARFGLELFKRLNLQLLIVTPLQKIHIIEPYVASVGFVHNEEGRRSMLRNLSIAEYRAERDGRRT